MGCRYILLLGERVTWSQDGCSDIAHRLLAMGLQERHASAGARLFAAPGTPTLRLSDGGTAIGHVFRRDGARILDPLQLQDGFWGEYLLVESGAHGDTEVRITRDASGGVACVYCISNGSGFVTSDISIATRLGLYEKRVDWDFVAHFLAYPYVKSERTALTGIREVLPGTTLCVRDRLVSTTLVWSPWDSVMPGQRHARIEDAGAQLRTAVETVVRAWAKVDGAAVVELSGGLDSSIVALCLRDMVPKPLCVTLLPELPGADERMYADAITNSLGTELCIEALTVEAARFDGAVPDWCVSPGIGPLQHAVDGIMDGVAAREGRDAFYSGGGGDTVFGFLASAAPAADAFLERGPGAGMRAVRDLAELHRCTYWFAARMALRKLQSPRSTPQGARSELLEPTMLPEAPDAHPWTSYPDDALPGDRERIEGLAGTQLFRDTVPRGMHRWLRLPLLSQPVMECCLSIPSWMWIAGGRNRSVARHAFADVLPPVALHRRSKGIFSQYNGAFYGRSKRALRSFLLDGELQARHLLNTEALSTLFSRPPAPRDRSFMRIIDLCRVENWLRHQP